MFNWLPIQTKGNNRGRNFGNRTVRDSTAIGMCACCGEAASQAHVIADCTHKALADITRRHHRHTIHLIQESTLSDATIAVWLAMEAASLEGLEDEDRVATYTHWSDE